MYQEQRNYIENQMENTASQASNLIGHIQDLLDDLDSQILLDWDDPEVDICDVLEEDVMHSIREPSLMNKKCDNMIQNLLYLRSLISKYSELEEIYKDL